MHLDRLAVAGLLIGIAAPAAASLYALGRASAASPPTAVAAVALVVVVALSIGLGVLRRSRPDTPYW